MNGRGNQVAHKVFRGFKDVQQGAPEHGMPGTPRQQSKSIPACDSPCQSSYAEQNHSGQSRLAAWWWAADDTAGSVGVQEHRRKQFKRQADAPHIPNSPQPAHRKPSQVIFVKKVW